MDRSEKTILVTGATGRQGGAVVRHLLADSWKVRALTRTLQRSESQMLQALGVEVVEGDFDLPFTIENALKGCYGVFSVQQPWEHGVDREVVQGKSIAHLAKAAGVRHFVYSSIGGADRNSGVPFFESKITIEKYIKTLTLPYTIVRPVYFMENFLSMLTRKNLQQGFLSMALNSDTVLQLIAVDDIGKFVALAFREPAKFLCREIEIASDEGTPSSITRALEVIAGRPLIFHQKSLDELRSGSAGLSMMFDWINRVGFMADIKAIRKIIPDLTTFDQWCSMQAYISIAA